jgi:hypothetical protein
MIALNCLCILRFWCSRALAAGRFSERQSPLLYSTKAKSGGMKIPPSQPNIQSRFYFCDNLAKDKRISAFFRKLPVIIFGFFSLELCAFQMFRFWWALPVGFQNTHACHQGETIPTAFTISQRLPTAYILLEYISLDTDIVKVGLSPARRSQK